jgi:hypothetical protein
MPIWGWVCSGLVIFAGIALFLLVIWADLHERKMAKRYAEDAELVVGWIVQANKVLYYPESNLERPAQILVSASARSDPPDPFMADLAKRVAALKGEEPETELEAEVAKLVNDESYREFERFLLPLEFTSGREVYSMHIWVKRSLLPGGALRNPFVRCLVLWDDPATGPRMVAYQPGDDSHQM